MDWIKKHYDGVILLVMGLISLGAAAWALSLILDFESLFTDRNSPKPRDNNIPSANVEPLAAAAAALKAKPAWKSHDGTLFASRVYILKDGELVDPIEGDRPLHPPVPNEWLLKYDLDYTQSDVLESDPDGDGFTVLEEWRAGTDPTNKESTPPLWTKLRLDEFEQIPFNLKFSGTPDAGETFTVNFIDDRRRPTKFLKIGETVTISDIPYVVAKYEEKFVTDERTGIERDVSELVLKNQQTGEQIVLVKGQVTNSPSSFGRLLNLLDGTITDKLKVGETFSIAQEPETKYRIEELSADRAIISKVSTGEKLEIPRK